MDVLDPLKVPTAFYTVADRRFFPGLVALLNSIRLVGHDEPLFVVDAGLTAEQRELLGDRVTLVPAPSPPLPAVFLAPVGPQQHPAEVAVLIDADIIVTRPLGELIEAARGGRVVGFTDCPDNGDRFFPAWASALGLGPLRRQPYLNAGLLIFPHSLSGRLLPPWTEGQTTIGTRGTRYGKGRLEDPFYFADQDVLNAVLAARFEPAELRILDHRLAPHPPFHRVSLIDEERLSCRYEDGAEPFLLHHVLAKPWLKATRSSVYSTLLTRLLLSADVCLRLDPSTLPTRLRRGRLARVERFGAGVAAALRSNGARQLGRFGIRTRIRHWRARHATG